MSLINNGSEVIESCVFILYAFVYDQLALLVNERIV